MSTGLNPNQERAVSIRLRLLEERLALIRHLADSDEHGILYRRDRARFSPDQRARMDALMAEVHGEIAALAEALALPREEQDAARRIVGILAMTWQSLGDIRSVGLHGHGEVDPAVPALVDPPVDRLMGLVLELEKVASGGAPPSPGPRR